MHHLTATEQAATTLLTRRIDGSKGELLPNACRAQNNESAFAIQSKLSELWCEQLNDSVGGWKCLQPIEGNWVVAPIYTSTINTIPPVALFCENNIARIEPELAFYFSTALPVRELAYLPDEIDAAIGRTHMALELIYNRFVDASQCSHFDKLADGLVNQGLFVGPQIDADLAANASQIDITLSYANHTEQRKGEHPNTMPRAPLYWLVEFLRQQGIGIEAGQAIITGSYAGVLEVPLNRDIQVDYASLGKMEVHFLPKLST